MAELMVRHLDRTLQRGQGAGPPKVAAGAKDEVRARLAAGDGILKAAKAAGLGSSTVQRIKAKMVTALWLTFHRATGGDPLAEAVATTLLR